MWASIGIVQKAMLSAIKTSFAPTGGEREARNDALPTKPA